MLTLLILIASLSYSSSQETDECQCVIYYQCDKGIIITDGRGIIGEKIDTPCDCGAVASGCPKEHVCCSLLPKNDQIDTNTTHKGCGFRNPEGIGFKIGEGTDNTNFGEFPWMVGIVLDSGVYRCGASLIHPSVVLTAAHCVTRKNTYIARAGDWDSSTTQELLKHQDLTVSSIKIHEGYYPPLYHNDVALLFLNGSFNLAPHIKPVCLPPTGTVVKNERCYVTGWGKDRFGTRGQYDAILKRVDLPLVESKDCETSLRGTNLGKNYNLHKSSLCAGGENEKDACIGDGGGPLVCPIPGTDERYQQIGVVSWGIECNQKNAPGVYANVQFLREWIDAQMKERNLDLGQYQY